jgi:hypothetical protein
MNTELVFALVAMLAVVALIVSSPLSAPAAAAAQAEDRRAELEAAKQAKYREIRDAQLDFRLGKVSAADNEATERELQAQAVAILRELDDLP